MSELEHEIEQLELTIKQLEEKISELESEVMGWNNFIRSCDIQIESLDERTDASAIQYWMDRKAEAIRERDRLLEELNKAKQQHSYLTSYLNQLKSKREIEERKEEIKDLSTTEQQQILQTDYLSVISGNVSDISSYLKSMSDNFVTFTTFVTGLRDSVTTYIQNTLLPSIPNVFGNILKTYFSIEAITTFFTSAFTSIGFAIGKVLMVFVEPVTDIMSGLFDSVIQRYTPQEVEKFGAPMRRVIEDFYNALMYEPPATPEKAFNAASSFLGVTVTLTNITHLIASAIESIGNLTIAGTKIGLRGFSRWAYSLQFALGLNWLSWTVFSSLARITISEPLEQYLNQIYRSKVLSVSEAEDAFKKGIINLNDFINVLVVHGYNDDSIEVLATKLLVEVSEEIEKLEVQYADVNEDLTKLLTVTIPKVEEDIEELKMRKENISKVIEERKKIEVERLKTRYEPKISELKEKIAVISKPIEDEAMINIATLEAILEADLTTLEEQKKLAKTYEAMYKLQLRQQELQSEFEAKASAIWEKAQLEIRKRTEEMQIQLEKIQREYEQALHTIEEKYKLELDKETSKINKQIANLERQLYYYEAVKKPLLEKKLKRIENKLKRLKEATTMSEPEDLLEKAYITLKKEKKLVELVDKEKAKKQKLKL